MYLTPRTNNLNLRVDDKGGVTYSHEGKDWYYSTVYPYTSVDGRIYAWLPVPSKRIWGRYAQNL